ncbi:MAG: hypothetical protein WA081_08625 [Desulfosalsimonadaceae bacterium]
MVNKISLYLVIFGMALFFSIHVTLAEVPISAGQTRLDAEYNTTAKQKGEKGQPETRKSNTDAEDAEPETEQKKTDSAVEYRTESQKETSGIFPLFMVTNIANTSSIDAPGRIDYTIVVKNTGNTPLSGIRISGSIPGYLSAPIGDAGQPGALDVDETWIFTGKYTVTQEVINGNGVNDSNAIDGDGDIDSTITVAFTGYSQTQTAASSVNVIRRPLFTATKPVFDGKGLDSNRVPDGDGDIDSSVIVDFIETDPPQTAYAGVKTEPFIGGEIFEKNRRYVHGFFSAARIFTSNLYKTDNNPEPSWATFLTPGIWAAVPSTPKRSVEIITANASPGGLAMSSFNPEDRRPYQAYLLYSPQLEIYHDQSIRAYQDPDIDENVQELTGQDSLDRLSHRVDAFLHYHSGNKLSLGAMDQYKIGYDAFSERAYTADDKYNSNLFNVSATFDATPKSQLRLDYSNFNLDYNDTINSDSDRLDNAIAAFLFFRMTAKTSAFVEYDFADINYDTSEKDSHEHRYFAGLRWQMTGKSSGLIKGGFGKKASDTTSVLPDTDQSISDISINDWMAEIQIDHNLNSRTNLTLNAYRRYDEVLEHRYDYGNLQDFYADYILAHFAGLSLKRDVTKKIHLLMDASVFYDEFSGSRRSNRLDDLEERKDTKFSVSPSISYDVFDWMTINGAYIYTDQDSNYPAYDYIDHTFFLRANFSL